MQIQSYLRILRESWWIIIAVVLISMGVGLAYSYAQTPIYEAKATFVVNPTVRIAETYDQLYSIDTLASRTTIATTYKDILESRFIIDSATATLGIPPEMLEKYKINGVVLPDSNVLMLRIQGPSPELAADLTNAMGTAGLDLIGKLQSIYELRRLDPATVESEPIFPDHLSDVTLAAVIGLLGGVAFVILRQALLQLSHPPQASIPVLTSSISQADGNKNNVQNVRSKTSA